MFELCDNLIGIYKTFNCTKTITIDPRIYDKRETSQSQNHRETNESQSNRENNQNQTNGETNASQSNRSVENVICQNRRNADLSQDGSATDNAQSSRESASSDATQRNRSSLSSSQSVIDSSGVQSNATEKVIDASYQSEEMEVDC